MFTINFKTFLNKKKNYFKAYKPCVYQQNKMRPLKILKMIIVGLGTIFQDKQAQKKTIICKETKFDKFQTFAPNIIRKKLFLQRFSIFDNKKN